MFLPGLSADAVAPQSAPAGGMGMGTMLLVCALGIGAGVYLMKSGVVKEKIKRFRKGHAKAEREQWRKYMQERKARKLAKREKQRALYEKLQARFGTTSKKRTAA